MHANQAEIDRNFDYFQRHVASYLPDEEGKYALLHDAKVVQFYESPLEAERDGLRAYPDNLFSIQEVTTAPVDLGFFTHAFDNG